MISTTRWICCWINGYEPTKIWYYPLINSLLHGSKIQGAKCKLDTAALPTDPRDKSQPVIIQHPALGMWIHASRTGNYWSPSIAIIDWSTSMCTTCNNSTFFYLQTVLTLWEQQKPFDLAGLPTMCHSVPAYPSSKTASLKAESSLQSGWEPLVPESGWHKILLQW